MDSIIKMDKLVIKEIKKRLESHVYSTVNASTQLDCGLQTIQAIYFLSRAVEDFLNCGIIPNVTLLHGIDMYCDNFYKYF